MKTKLREHPELIDQGVRTWPPNWVRTSGKETTATDGEIGILKDVKTYDAISSRCFLLFSCRLASQLVICAANLHATERRLESRRFRRPSRHGWTCLRLCGDLRLSARRRISRATAYFIEQGLS
jgi:hypothetical protein